WMNSANFGSTRRPPVAHQHELADRDHVEMGLQQLAEIGLHLALRSGVLPDPGQRLVAEIADELGGVHSSGGSGRQRPTESSAEQDAEQGATPNHAVRLTVFFCLNQPSSTSLVHGPVCCHHARHGSLCPSHADGAVRRLTSASTIFPVTSSCTA